MSIGGEGVTGVSHECTRSMLDGDTVRPTAFRSYLLMNGKPRPHPQAAAVHVDVSLSFFANFCCVFDLPRTK